MLYYARGQMRQRFFDLIDEDQTLVAWLKQGQAAIDGDEFAADFFDMAGAFCALQPFAQQTKHLAIGTTTLAGVFEQNDVVEGSAKHARELAQVFISTVTGTADDDSALHFLLGGQRVKGRDQGTHGMRIVAVISTTVASR